MTPFPRRLWVNGSLWVAAASAALVPRYEYLYAILLHVADSIC
jgi:predicted ATPase